MHSRARILLVIGLVVGTVGVSGQAKADEAMTDKAAPGPKFRVEPMGPATLTTEFASRLATAATTGLAAAGADVLPAAGAGPGACVGAACVQPPAAGTTAADYLLRGTCIIEGSTYRLHLELVDARTNSVAVGRDDLCEICTDTEAADAANVAASALKVALDRSLREAVPVPALVPPPNAPPPVEPRAVAPWRRALPWVAFGVGAAAIGGGIYYLAINGNGTDHVEDPVPRELRRYDTTWRWGIPLIGVGVGAAVVGVLTLPRRSSSATESTGVGAAPGSPPPPTSSLAGPRVRGLTLLPGGAGAWGTF